MLAPGALTFYLFHSDVGYVFTSKRSASILSGKNVDAKDFFLLVLISVKTGLYLGPCANVVVDLRVEIALHDILLVVPIVCACPAAWGIGNLH